MQVSNNLDLTSHSIQGVTNTTMFNRYQCDKQKHDNWATGHIEEFHHDNPHLQHSIIT